MDEELNVDPKYKEAFNNGYLIAKHQPDLFKDMPANMNNAYGEALLAGKQQFDKEREAQKAKDYFKSFDRDNGKDRDKDKGIKR